jgi:hypothetical protein
MQAKIIPTGKSKQIFKYDKICKRDILDIAVENSEEKYFST